MSEQPGIADDSDSDTAVLAKSKKGLGSWHDIARSGGVKFLAQGVSAVLGIFITRLILGNYGTDAYAQYGLLVGLGGLLPIGALGIGAPIMNTVAASDAPGKDHHLRRILVSSLRVLSVAAAVLIVVVILITAFGWWSPILGPSLLTGGAIAAALCLGFWALGMPFGVGQRVLAGLGKNHVTIAIGGLQSPVVLLVLLVAVWLGIRDGSFIPVVPYVTTFAIAVLCTVVAARIIRPTLSEAIRESPFPKRFPGEKILDQAGPMTIIMIALPLSAQTDRIVLSHVAGTEALAQYNLAAQMFLPISALVSAAGLTLWPRFAAARAKGKDESPLPLSLMFGVIAAVMCLGVAVLSPWLAHFASDGDVTLSLTLILSFAAWMIIQGLQYPMGMYLTDKSGLRFQALMVSIMAPMNVGLSWILAGTIGAAGPVMASAIGVLVFQVIANVIFVRYRRNKPAQVGA